MIETFTALLFAHVLADFLFQTGWINANKRRPGVMLLHGAIVLVTAQAALGQLAAPGLLALALAHMLIDSAKALGRFTGLGAFLADQAAHLASLAALALWAPGLWAQGAWAALLPPGGAALLLHAMALVAGLVVALRAGDFAIRALMAGHAMPGPAPPGPATATADTALASPDEPGLPGGGRTIGHLERLLVFVLVLAGQITAIGFLVAAKSILRFGSIADDRRATEYVIIGTLASFGWAITVALATQTLRAALPGP